jgi:predicted lipoprotein
MNFARQRLCLLGTLFVVAVAASGPAASQADWARLAVPAYEPAHLLRGLHEHWTAPRAAELAAQAQALVPALQRLCDAKPAQAADTPGASPGAQSAQSADTAAGRLRTAREHWRTTTTAWERLAAVALGPVVERRSIRQLDFTPTRPASIEKAIAAAPRGAEAMERVGTPAKGLPALEWLLWAQPMPPGSPSCRYAVEVAAVLAHEAAELQAAFQTLAERPIEGWDAAATEAAMTEFLNQWVGGIERLRWAQIEKPLRAHAGSAAAARADLPRATSGSTATSWAAHWQGLRALAVFEGDAAPAPGAGLVPIETYLRGRGQNALADRLRGAVQQVDRALQGTTPDAAPAMTETARQLAALKHLAEADVAPALDVSIGFSDADGD